jgi:hypothetical protein
VRRPLTNTRSSLAYGAALALLTLGLVACGVTPQSTTEVTPPVPLSPAAGEMPEERAQASATITEDGLDPDRFAGQIGTGFTLTITGDGEEHTLIIQDLVAETAIAADGETNVTFTVAGDPGVSDITLDGDVVGAFERQSAAGITSD